MRKTDISESHNTSEQKKNSATNIKTMAGLLVMVLLVVGLVSANVLIKNPQDIRQRAAPPGLKTATMNMNPSSASIFVGQQFTVSLVIDGGGQAFNAAQAVINVSSNLAVQSLTIVPANSGGCNFTYINQNKTPKVSDLSFTGAVLNAAQTTCTVFTVTLQAVSAGVGTVTLTRPQVKAYSNSSEILLSSQNGTYTVNSPVSPTPTPTNAPTATPIPTATPTNAPTATPTPLPTATPIPSATPTPTPIVLAPPTVNSIPTETYINSIQLSGTKTINLTSIFINGLTNGVTYPSNTSWQFTANLTQGANNFVIFGKDAGGVSSSSVNATINLHKLADIDGDGAVDLTDLSMFATDWENTGTLNHILSDMDADGLVDLSDFSILARQYGN